LPRVAASRRQLFVALGEAVLSEERVQALDALVVWRAVEARDPFAP